MSSCTPHHGSESPSAILLFNGEGTSRNSVHELERILRTRGWDYALMDSQELNASSAASLRTHPLLIIPGGNYLRIGDSLTPETLKRVHDAVVEGGMNYLGICAGGLLAGKAQGKGLDLAEGVRFGFYAVVNQGIHKTSVTITQPDGTPIDHYWEDGPQFSGWGDVVGRYPDQTPAIVEGRTGKGWTILCGVHPEAPESWRKGMHFQTSVQESHAEAERWIEAALRGVPLPHFK